MVKLHQPLCGKKTRQRPKNHIADILQSCNESHVEKSFLQPAFAQNIGFPFPSCKSLFIHPKV